MKTSNHGEEVNMTEMAGDAYNEVVSWKLTLQYIHQVHTSRLMATEEVLKDANVVP